MDKICLVDSVFFFLLGAFIMTIIAPRIFHGDGYYRGYADGLKVSKTLDEIKRYGKVSYGPRHNAYIICGNATISEDVLADVENLISLRNYIKNKQEDSFDDNHPKDEWVPSLDVAIDLLARYNNAGLYADKNFRRILEQ